MSKPMKSKVRDQIRHTVRDSGRHQISICLRDSVTSQFWDAVNSRGLIDIIIEVDSAVFLEQNKLVFVG